MFYYNGIEMCGLFLLLIFTTILLFRSNVLCLWNVPLDCFQQYMLKYTKNFFPESDLMKWGCVIFADASFLPSNMISQNKVGLLDSTFIFSKMMFLKNKH